jgi:hypothetical protein
MSTIHFSEATTLTPEQYVAGLIREGNNAKGRFLALVLGTVGKGVLGKAFAKSVKAIEARNDGAAATTGATVAAES